MTMIDISKRYDAPEYVRDISKTLQHTGGDKYGTPGTPMTPKPEGVEDVYGTPANPNPTPENPYTPYTPPEPESHGGGGGGGDYVSKQWEAYKHYRPQAAEMEYQMYSQYAPLYAQKQKETMDKLYPYQSGLGELIGKDITERLKKDPEAPEWMKEQYKRSRAEADTSRGMYYSGMSGRAEAEDLARMGYDVRQQDYQTAMQLYGGIPKAQYPGSIPGQTPQVPDYSMAEAEMALTESMHADDMAFKREGLEWQKEMTRMELEAARDARKASEKKSWMDPLIGGAVNIGSEWAISKFM